MVKGAVDGYYEILENKIVEGKKVQITLGQYYKLADNWHNIYGKMKPWELLSKDDCCKLSCINNLVSR